MIADHGRGSALLRWGLIGPALALLLAFLVNPILRREERAPRRRAPDLELLAADVSQGARAL